jgi:phage FluMu gp28-like protein
VELTMPALRPVVDFLPYQRRWIADGSRFKIGMFARQTGKTFSTGGEAVDDVVQAEMAGRRARWVVLSRGERQAREMMEEVLIPFSKAYWSVYDRLLKGRPEFVEGEFLGGDDARYQSLEIRYPGGSRITALPANPDTARGFSANVVLDEFAFHAKSRDIWRALFPVISKGGQKLRVISTPNGKGNKFFELMTAEDAAWSRHVCDIHQAVAQGLDRDIPALRAALADEDAWAQEFELQWLDEASAWLSYELIAAAEHEQAGDPAGYAGGPCFVGVDIARRKDLFVIWVLEAVGDVLWTRAVIARRRISFAEQDQLLAEVFARYRVVRCAMDQTGMGEKPVEDAQRVHGASRVEGVILSGPRRLDLATALKTRLEDRTLRLPAGDPVIRADLHAIKAQPSLTGGVRLVADDDTDGHADRFWAAALAAGAAASPYQPYAWRPVPRAPAPARAGELAMRPDAIEAEDARRKPGFGRIGGAW